MNTEYLFVYGTLRKDFEQSLLHTFREAATYVGLGKIEGILYNLGSYPGAGKRATESLVNGEVFAINGDNVFPVLDDYEGEEYTREKVKVKTENGKELEAWVYWHSGNVAKAQRIHEGDYLLYLKNRKERFA